MNRQTIILALAALGLGLLGGYLLFAGGEAPGDVHQHETMDAGGGAAEIWTCSMHPQIQQPEPGDCPLCGMDLIPLTSGNSTDPAVLTMTEAAVAMARVRTITLGGGTETSMADEANTPEDLGGNQIQLSGRLAADESTYGLEVAEYGGRIERLFVSFPGERVRRGQRVATIYAPELAVAQEELLQARRYEDINPSLVEAARRKLRNLEMTEPQIDTLLATGEVLSNFPVYADQSATILEVKSEVGQYVRAGEALYTHTNLNTLWVLFDAYETDLSRIEVGDRVTFSVPSRPGETYVARITFVDPFIDPETRTAAVRAEVRNSNGRLKPEMFVEGTIEVGAPLSAERSGEKGAERESFVVPRTAILWTGERSVAYVEVPDASVPTYTFREVSVAGRVGEGYRVTEGLSTGDKLVVNGAFQIDASAQLNNKASMMNRDVYVRGREPEAETALVIPDYREESPEAFREQLGKLVEAYLPVKDEMVATQTTAATQIDPILDALNNVNMSLVKGEAHVYWMRQLDAVRAHAEAMAEATDIDAQREQFGFLSQALINALTAFGVSGDYYVQHCPMAFDNTGANWVSDEKQIRNPYFGDLMMSCGMVTEEL